MIIEKTLSILKDIAENIAAESVQDRFNDVTDSHKLKETIEVYLSRQQEYNEICSMAEEVDFEELSNFARDELIGKTKQIIKNHSAEQREHARADLISYVCASVIAKTPEAKQRVDRLLGTLINSIINYFRNKNSPEHLVLANDIVDEIRREQIHDKEEIISSIEELTQRITQTGTSFYFGKNIELPKSTSPYAYDSRMIAFTGREEELEFLRGFLNDSAQCRWLCLYGGASTGKKRIVYQLFEELDQADEWDHTCILKRVNSLPGILNEIQKNTVICIEYASEHLQEIEDFISMAEDRFSFQPHIKIRAILIEREPIELDQDDDLYELKNSFYNALQIKALSHNEILKLTSSYTDNIDYSFQKFIQLDPEGEKLTLLFLVADQREDKENYSALEYWYKNECEKIALFHGVISMESIRNLLVFATMIGGGDLTEMKRILHLEEDETLWIRVLVKLGYYNAGQVLPINPGILGEYFCLQSFNDSEKSRKLIDILLEKDLYSTASFFERLYTDYDIEQCAWAAKITNIEIPDSHSRIPGWIFKGKRFLRSVQLGESVVEVGRSAFQACGNLRDVTIMPMLEIISANAFRDCIKLKEVRLFDSKDSSALRRIGRWCFKGCVSLEFVELPSTCAEIEEQAFYRCESLKQIILPKWLRVINSELFAYCCSLEGIHIQSKCKEIGTSAFLNDTSLKYVRGANQVEIIRGTAFKGCRSLCELPTFKNVSHINVGAFEGDEALERVDLSETQISDVNKKVFFRCTGLNTVLFPDGVRLIGDSAFEGASALVSIQTTNSVQKVGNRAFYGCNSLQSFDFLHNIKFLGPQAIIDCAKLSGSYHFDKAVCFSGIHISYVSESIVATLRDLRHVKKIIVPASIKIIEPETFAGLHNLEEIVIDGAESVGDRCFSGCINLRKAYVNAQKIGNSAFYECYNLQQIEFGSKVKVIEENAFAHCVSLSKMIWPVGQTTERIGRNALTSTGIRRLPFTKDICGFSFKHFGEEEIEFLQKLETAKKITVPGTVTSMTNGAFQRLLNLQEIKFEGEIDYLPSFVFAGCENLERIIITKPFRSIGDNAFQGCKRLITFCPNNNLMKTVVGKGVFSGCESLERIQLNPNIRTIPQYMFYNCHNLQISLPQNIDSIGDYAFNGCDRLTSITFVGKNIGFGAFKGCCQLIAVDLSRSRLTELKNDVFQDDIMLQEVYLPLSLTKIGSGAFKACRKLTEVNLPARVQEIGIGAFQNCSALCEISIPREVRMIKAHAFRGCYSLKNVGGLKGLISLGASVFYQCISLKDIHLPDGIKELGTAAFYACKSLCAFSIPNSIKTLSDNLFERCENLSEICLPEGIEAIPVNFAKDCFSLKTIGIPQNVRMIRAGAFRNCELLNEVRIPKGVAEIEASTFFGCKSLTKINIPSSVHMIRQTAFYRCSNLKTINIEGAISWIGSYAFAHAYDLKAFPFDKVNGEIGDGSFKWCKSLSEVRFGSITNLGSSVFWGCDSLEEANVINLKVIPGATFRKCNNLKTVRLGETVRRISRAAFRECVELQEVEILSDSIDIQANAFYDCKSLKMIELPDDSVIDSEAFVNCPAQRYVSVQ